LVNRLISFLSTCEKILLPGMEGGGGIKENDGGGKFNYDIFDIL
jgi:hypothetical protein